MASLKDVRMKITGVGKTKQVTKAMNMVSSAKLRGAQQRIECFRPYAEKYNEVLMTLAEKADSGVSPLMQRRDEVKSVGIILISSDRGLCGGFNINLISAALKLAKQKNSEGKKVLFYCLGRKGRDAVRKLGYALSDTAGCDIKSIDFAAAAQLGSGVMHAFQAGVLDEVYLVYAKFVSLAKNTPVTQALLPIAPPVREAVGEGEKKEPSAEYMYEPDAGVLLSTLLPRYVNVQIYRGILDTSASEHAARMVAMDNATRNCDEMTSALTLLFNRTRQAAITTDLIDIVSGAEALNG